MDCLRKNLTTIKRSILIFDLKFFEFYLLQVYVLFSKFVRFKLKFFLHIFRIKGTNIFFLAKRQKKNY